MRTLTENIEPRAPGSPLTFTAAAIARVKALLAEENNPKLNLRVFIEGGGCSGFQYGFSFEETVNDDDTLVDESGIRLLIDRASFQYLQGAEVDYQDDLGGAQFVIHNPNAASTCGCGSSFSA
ncbi:MAG: iron-sulfur cluster insertion protein ErpA [Candidimonas sp.]|nr:MAG: iron-sulfur cluster insertion protein ErpA [Candidimonas sp.]